MHKFCQIQILLSLHTNSLVFDCWNSFLVSNFLVIWILNSLGQRSQYISIKFPLYKQKVFQPIVPLLQISWKCHKSGRTNPPGQGFKIMGQTISECVLCVQCTYTYLPKYVLYELSRTGRRFSLSWIYLCFSWQSLVAIVGS